MRYLPVHWYEGLFLRPHHFQANDRHLAEMMQTSLEFDQPYHYGIRSLELADRALENYQFEVRALRARMQDGTIIDLGTGQSLDRLDLRPAFRTQDLVTVYLAVPRVELGMLNVAPADKPSEISRFREHRMTLQDESRGGNDKEVRFKALNVKLLSSCDDHAGYEILPLARVERASDRGAVPRLDATYFPPALAIEAWPPLGRDVVVAIGDIIGGKVEVLGQQISNSNISFDSNEPGDLERMLLLDRLLGISASLSLLTSTRGVHPYDAYRLLVSIVGGLAIFGKGRALPKIPAYDHDDLARIFREVMRLIDLLLHTERDFTYEQRYFGGAGAGMQVTLEPRWLNPDWTWYVGVHKDNISDEECRELLSPGRLDWKLGSSRQVEFLFTRGAEGLELIPLQQTPRALPARRHWVFFAVNRANKAWKDVQISQTLAIRFRESLILNRDRMDEERNLVVANGDRQVTLQIALFAVPGRD